MLEGVLHGAGLGVARVEEHQHQIRQVDDVIGEFQRRGALRVGVETRRIDENLTAQVFAVAGLELQVGIHPRAFAGGDGFQIPAHLIEGKAGVGIESESRQHALLVVVAVADDRELVVDGLVAGYLQLVSQIEVDEG